MKSRMILPAGLAVGLLFLVSASSAQAGLLGDQGCCEPTSCCEVTCCDPCCAPRVGLVDRIRAKIAARRACRASCEPVCCEPVCCEPCCDPCCTPRVGLLDRIRAKIAARRACRSCCEPVCCEPACCEPTCGCQ